MRDFTGKMPRPRWIPRLRLALCASLRSRNAHGHVARPFLCQTRIKERPRPTLCASLRSRNPHGHVTRAILYAGILKTNTAPQMHPKTESATLREPAQSGSWSRAASRARHFISEFSHGLCAHVHFDCAGSCKVWVNAAPQVVPSLQPTLCAKVRHVT